MQTMTKNDIIQNIHKNLGYSKKDSAQLVENVFEIIKENLTRGEKIKISGFGSFTVKEKQAQKGRNPQTGDEIEIGARKVLTFKPSQVLRKALND
jgi:integration host factor subunit alpha